MENSTKLITLSPDLVDKIVHDIQKIEEIRDALSHSEALKKESEHLTV